MQMLNNVLVRNARKVQRDIRHRFLGSPWMEVEARDRFLFSYPRSGNTWLRHIVQHLIAGPLPDELSKMDDLVPTIDTIDFKDRLMRMPPGLRFFKSHLPHSEYFFNGKVVYIVRDGRDVLISRYDLYRSIKNYGGSLEDFMDKMIAGRIRYGSWHANVGGWVRHRDHDNMLMVRFEDLKADAFGHARKIADFVGIGATDQDIETALAASSVEKVHSTMRSWSYARNTGFQGGATGGGKKTWRETLTPSQNRQFVDQCGELLEALGYPLD
jgi:hypothetical protein